MSPGRHLVAMGAILGAALFLCAYQFCHEGESHNRKADAERRDVLCINEHSFLARHTVRSYSYAMAPPIAAPTCALVYLAIAGSALAFPAFFYVLRHSSLMFASTLAFVRPVIALLLVRTRT